MLWTWQQHQPHGAETLAVMQFGPAELALLAADDHEDAALEDGRA